MRIECILARATVVLLSVILSTSTLRTRAVCGQQPSHEIVSRKNVMVPMRDGVKLATDIYLPAKDGKPIQEKLPVKIRRYSHLWARRVRL